MSGLRARTVLVATVLAAFATLSASATGLGGSTPVITGIVPARPAPAAKPQHLTINGRDFQPRLELIVTTPEGGTVQLKETAIQSRTATEFQVDVLLVTRGRYTLVVTNPDGGMSTPFVLDVQAPSKPPLPLIDRILPEDIRRSPDAQTLTVQGRYFGPGLRAVVTDPAGAEVAGVSVRDLTTSSFTLIVLLDRAGSYTLVVTNSSGATSNVATIVVR